MTRIVLTALMATTFWFAAGTTVSTAQERCPEGRAVGGACVNPLLVAGMREVAIIFSQPKISQTAFPVLPSADRAYRYPNQLIPDPLKPAPTAGPPIP
jgi:hypothetical protein